MNYITSEANAHKLATEALSIIEEQVHIEEALQCILDIVLAKPKRQFKLFLD